MKYSLISRQNLMKANATSFANMDNWDFICKNMRC